MPTDFASLYERIQYSFKSERVLLNALTHRSKGSKNNERLEFLGDSILSFVIADALCEMHPEAPEGELSRLRSYLVKGETLAEIARELDLGKHLRLGQGERRSGGSKRDSILADCFEALIAAIYLDADIDTCKTVLVGIYQDRLRDKRLRTQSKDPKTELQEYLQGKKLPLPVYSLVKVEGEQHQQRFTIECVVDSLDVKSEGYGESRRKAEKEAAVSILQKLKKGE